MHINLESDYAIRIIVFLAKSKNKVDAKTIAENTGVSLRFSLKILRKLVASKVISSFKGSKGGYQILKEPEEITLRDIIRIVEGEYCISRCIDSECDCSLPNQMPCKVKNAFYDISLQVRNQLEKIKISELL
jgi:Rrf2 family protein